MKNCSFFVPNNNVVTNLHFYAILWIHLKLIEVHFVKQIVIMNIIERPKVIQLCTNRNDISQSIHVDKLKQGRLFCKKSHSNKIMGGDILSNLGRADHCFVTKLANRPLCGVTSLHCLLRYRLLGYPVARI